MKCTNVDPDLFFDVSREAEAKSLCARCPILRECRDAARANGEHYGVFGGEDPAQRARYLVDAGRMDRERFGQLRQERLMHPGTRRMMDQGLNDTTRMARNRSQVLHLLEVERLSYAVAARRLGISKANVARIAQARRRAA